MDMHVRRVECQRPANIKQRLDLWMNELPDESVGLDSVSADPNPSSIGPILLE